MGSQPTPEITRSSAVRISSGGRPGPLRSTTGSPRPSPQAMVAGGAGAAIGSRRSVLEPLVSSPGNAPSRLVHAAEPACGASTGTRATGPVRGAGDVVLAAGRVAPPELIT